MLKRLLKAASRPICLLVACCPILFSTGCTVPTLNVVPGLPPTPTVSQLQDHIACVLARTMDKHLGPNIANDETLSKTPDYVLWHRLVDYNFLGTINLTLFVNQTEGLNPSFNFITPLTNLGNPIQKIVETSNGLNSPQNVTSNMNNFTLSVGFQLDGSQDHNFVLNYVVDMHRLYEQMYAYDQKGMLVPAKGGRLKKCDDFDRTSPSRGIPYGLKGDLALEDTLETGLLATDAASYSPVTAGSGSKSGQQTASVSQANGATGFSSKIDFSLTWGINGGPSWTLLKFKGPGGGTGPGGQLLNYSRQKMDTLIATFSATCETDKEDLFNDTEAFLAPYVRAVPNSGKFDSFEIEALKRRTPPLGGKADYFTTQILNDGRHRREEFEAATALYQVFVSIPQDQSGLPYTSISTAPGALAIDTFPTTIDGASVPLSNASIAWSGFINNSDVGKKDNIVSYSLRGSITDVESANFLGYIYADIGKGSDGRSTAIVRISRNAVKSLMEQTTSGPITYWQSLPSCSNAGPFLSNGLNVLQQLPGGVGSTLEQQP